MMTSRVKVPDNLRLEKSSESCVVFKVLYLALIFATFLVFYNTKIIEWKNNNDQLSSLKRETRGVVSHLNLLQRLRRRVKSYDKIARRNRRESSEANHGRLNRYMVNNRDHNISTHEDISEPLPIAIYSTIYNHSFFNNNHSVTPDGAYWQENFPYFPFDNETFPQEFSSTFFGPNGTGNYNENRESAQQHHYNNTIDQWFQNGQLPYNFELQESRALFSNIDRNTPSGQKRPTTAPQSTQGIIKSTIKDATAAFALEIKLPISPTYAETETGNSPKIIEEANNCQQSKQLLLVLTITLPIMVAVLATMIVLWIICIRPKWKHRRVADIEKAHQDAISRSSSTSRTSMRSDPRESDLTAIVRPSMAWSASNGQK